MIRPGDKLTLITQDEIMICTVVSVRKRAISPLQTAPLLTTSTFPVNLTNQPNRPLTTDHENHEVQVTTDPIRRVEKA